MRRISGTMFMAALVPAVLLSVLIGTFDGREPQLPQHGETTMGRKGKIMIWNGKVLYRRKHGSKIAIGKACCCGTPCEDCVRPPGGSEATMTGDATCQSSWIGAAVDWTVVTPTKWSMAFSGSCTTAGCEYLYNSLTFYLECIKGDDGCVSAYVLTTGDSYSGIVEVWRGMPTQFSPFLLEATFPTAGIPYLYYHPGCEDDNLTMVLGNPLP